MKIVKILIIVMAFSIQLSKASAIRAANVIVQQGPPPPLPSSLSSSPPFTYTHTFTAATSPATASIIKG